MEESGIGAGAIICFVILIIIEMFVYGFGTALHLLGSKEKEVEKKAEEEKSKRYIRLLRMMNDPNQYTNTLQIIVAIINLIIGGYYFGIFTNHLEKSLSTHLLPLEGLVWARLLSAILTGCGLIYILLTIGILLPRRLASKYPKQWAFFGVNLAYFLTKLMFPFTELLTVSANAIARVFGIKIDGEAVDVTEEEIISLVNEGHEQGVLEASEAEMITNIFEFGDKEAQDIMTHRANIVAVDANMTLEEAICFMVNESKSRYPVYDGDIDNIIGILHLKDAVRAHEVMKIPNDETLKDSQGIFREVTFIPETRNIDDLFRNMQSEKIQMVIVIDEYGQTAGLVAMEDILEEIVGNILDEYDEEEAHIRKKSENEYVIDGLTKLEDLERSLGISFHEEEYETLNGFLISKMERIPDEHDRFSIDVEGYHFKVVAVKNRMIQTVIVTKLTEDADNDPAEEKKLS